MSIEDHAFVVFEGEASSGGTTTADARHLLQGIEPKGYGDWEIEIRAVPKDSPCTRSDLERDANNGNPPDCDDYVACEDLESLLVDLMHCDYNFVDTTGEQCDTPRHSAAWEGMSHAPQNVRFVSEWDGNSGTVSWESVEHFFVMQYDTS